ncbi:MAG: hypothetical protein KC502_21580 [Myxococcales bacterium]|nr:hypothetical protein [Myxococcales bacterium]
MAAQQDSHFALLLLDAVDGLEPMLETLIAAKFRLVAVSHTAAVLAEAGFAVESLSALIGESSGFGEATDLGHTHLTGAMTVRWSDNETRKSAGLAGFTQIRLMIAQLPTSAAALGDGSQLDHGPLQARANLLRLAATHPDAVEAVLVDSGDFEQGAAALASGHLTDDTRAVLRNKALAHVAAFDRVLQEARGADSLIEQRGGLVLTPWPVEGSERLERLHDPSGWLCGVQPIEVLSGPLPDGQTLLTLDAALQMMHWPGQGVSATTAINGLPCAFALSQAGAPRALLRAMSADPVATQGGILTCSTALDVTAARALLRHPNITTLAVLAAPDFSDEAIELLATREDLLLLKLPGDGNFGARTRLRPTSFGVFMRQTADPYAAELPELTQLGTIEVNDNERANLLVALHGCRQLPQRAVCIADAEGTIALCGGQPHVMDAIQIATAKARRLARESAMVVDGTLLHPQAIDALRRSKVSAVAVRELGAKSETIIEAANLASIALLQLPEDWASAQL